MLKKLEKQEHHIEKKHTLDKNCNVLIIIKNVYLE
jgi:hypothetical protein